MAHILGSFLRQFLTAVSETIPDKIIQKLNDIQNGGRKVETEDILALLKMRLYQLKRSFICIDAVDELDPKVRQQLLDFLKELVTNYNTHLFLTGRSHVESEVQKHLKVKHGYTVNISATQHDIQEFVKQQIKEDHNLNPEAMDEVLEKDILDGIIKKSQGMYVMESGRVLAKIEPCTDLLFQVSSPRLAYQIDSRNANKIQKAASTRNTTN